MTGKEDMKSMSVRRAKLVDAGKVRYRVYRTPSDFVTVVAETALMAVRLSEVTNPYKIVRDIATEGSSIEAQKIAAPEVNAERIHFTLQEQNPYEARVAEMAEPSTEPSQPFVPVPLLDLQYKGSKRARILPPEMLHEIIEAHAKGLHKPAEDVPPAQPVQEEVMTKPPAREPAPPVYTPPPEPEPVAPPTPPEPEVIPQPLTPEALSALAQEVLPETSQENAPEEEAAPVLSPEEVAKLLNG